MDLIDRQTVIDALYDWSEHSMTDAEAWHIRQVIGDIKSLPPAEPNCSEIPNNSDCISRQAAIMGLIFSDGTRDLTCGQMAKILYVIKALPSAQPEPEHTMEEFMYGQDLGSPEDGSL